MTLTRLVDTGTYVGNGGTRAVSIGWQPALVVTHSTAGTSANRALSLKVDVMPNDDFMRCGAAAAPTTTNGVTLTADGFSAGSNSGINTNGQTYYWMAVRVGPWIDTGTYVGNSALAGTQDIILGRQPEIVVIFRMDASPKVGWSNIADANSSFYSTAWTRVVLPGYIPITSTGFTATNNLGDRWNDLNVTYQYFAFYALNDNTRHLESGFQTSPNGGTSTITTGKQPKVVWLFQNVLAGFKTVDMPGDDDGRLATDYTWNTANGLTINSDGFTIGSGYNTALGLPQGWLAWYE